MKITKRVQELPAAKGTPLAAPPPLNTPQLIDHTNLRPDATRADIERLCQEARQYKFYSVCVNPTWVSLARQLLDGSGVKVCCVAGFPLGAHLSETKAMEASAAIQGGFKNPWRRIELLGKVSLVMDSRLRCGYDFFHAEATTTAQCERTSRAGWLEPVPAHRARRQGALGPTGR